MTRLKIVSSRADDHRSSLLLNAESASRVPGGVIPPNPARLDTSLSPVVADGITQLINQINGDHP